MPSIIVPRWSACYRPDASQVTIVLASSRQITTLNALADIDGRVGAAEVLARRWAVATVLVLIRDRELGVLRPAPGFQKTMPGGTTWRALLKQEIVPRWTGMVAYPDKDRIVPYAAHGLPSQGAVLLLLGGEATTVGLDLDAMGFPLLAALLHAEGEAVAAVGLAKTASTSLDRAEALTASLDAARDKLAETLAESDRANRALADLNATLEQRVDERTRQLQSEMRERANAEERFRQSQKLEAIGQLTGGVAHDFNNLLTVIKSSTELLKRPSLTEERRARYVGAISDTVDRAAKLTSQLLAFARRQALTPVVIDAGASVAAIVDMLGTLTGSRITITTRLPTEACFINVDPSQFDTALVNMTVNARDAMNGEGRLTVSVEIASATPAVRSHSAISGDVVAVAITDTGSGIPADRLDRIFEPFFTTKAVGQGTGLGLSQVFGFAKQSGGEIIATSLVGEGTTFTLFLPRVVAPGAKPTIEAPKPIIDGHGTCVLLVEDNVEVGAFAADALKTLGFGTRWAKNAEEALEILARGADRFDIVFSDVMMPGMNGVDLAKEIRRLHGGLRVVLTSGYSHVLAQEGCHGVELLQKPYSIEQLSRALNNAVGRDGSD